MVYKGSQGKDIVARTVNGDYLSTSGDLGGTSIASSFSFQLKIGNAVDEISFIGIRSMQYIWDNNIGARLKITLRDGTPFYVNLSSS